MARRGRHHVLGVLVAPAFAAVALSSSAASALAAGSAVTVNVQVGYHNSVKLGVWMPVNVDVTNDGPDIDGTLEVQATGNTGGPPIGTAIYQAPVSLSAGATKHFRTYLMQDLNFPGSITARVVQGGRVIATKQASAASTSSGLLVGILSDQAATLDALAGLQPGGNRPMVVHLAPADLSDSVPVLRAFDVIAIDDFSTDTLTAVQKTALGDYVRQGGSLMLGTGGAWRKTLAGLPAGLVPMQVDRSTVLGSVAALGGASNLEVATGALSAGTSTWLSEGGRPLLVEAQAGKGLVALATFDWTQDSITGWSGYDSLLRQSLVRLTYGSIGNPSNGNLVGGKAGFSSSGSIAVKGGQLAGALGNLPALDLPAWWLIGTLVFVYVLLVGPINYFFLRAIGRRGLAWITVPAIALAASAGAYGTSVATKGTSVLANEVSVVHVEAGSDRAYDEEYTGIMTPTRGDYVIGIGEERRQVSPIYYYYGNVADPSAGALRIDTVGSDVTLPGMTAFTLRAFAREGMLPGAPDVAGEVKMAGGKLVGTIKNSSAIEFSDGVVISGNSFQKLGELRPGATASFSLQPSSTFGFTGMPLTMTIYPSNNQVNGVPPNNSSAVEREMETRSGILATVIPNAFPGLPASPQPVVLLWTRHAFQDVTVNGAHPRTYGESAVVLTLPVQHVGAGALPVGVVQGRVIDIDAQTSAGPPGTLIAQSGSITYAFDPPLAPGTHLVAAVVNNTNPFAAKGGPAGSSSQVRAQVWDWSRSAWIGVPYQDSLATSLPNAAVNPTSGEVLLKLSSDGQFATGSLSLTGTVG